MEYKGSYEARTLFNKAIHRYIIGNRNIDQCVIMLITNLGVGYIQCGANLYIMHVYAIVSVHHLVTHLTIRHDG